MYLCTCAALSCNLQRYQTEIINVGVKDVSGKKEISKFETPSAKKTYLCMVRYRCSFKVIFFTMFTCRQSRQGLLNIFAYWNYITCTDKLSPMKHKSQIMKIKKLEHVTEKMCTDGSYMFSATYTMQFHFYYNTL